MHGRRELVAQLRDLGLRTGDLAMVHTSLRAIGPLEGGPATLLDALLEVLGPDGTLMAYVAWAHSCYEETLGGRELPATERARWPMFDPADAPPPYDGFGQFNRFLCAHPRARRSAHPDASVAAIGRLAEVLTREHALVDGYGPGSPLDRFVAADGKVLMLGAPPDAVTVLHFAEAIASIPGKRRVRYEVPLRLEGERRWLRAEEYDTNGLLHALEEAGIDAIERIATDYVEAGHGVRGQVGRANCWLFDAPDLVAFGVRWLESRFG